VVAFIFAPLFLLSFGVPHEIAKQYDHEARKVDVETSMSDSLLKD
jgi:hypothetical protein